MGLIFIDVSKTVINNWLRKAKAQMKKLAAADEEASMAVLGSAHAKMSDRMPQKGAKGKEVVLPAGNIIFTSKNKKNRLQQQKASN